MNLYAWWLACGAVGWMGTVMILDEDRTDLLRPKLMPLPEIALSSLVFCLAGGPITLAFVVRKLWGRP